MVWEVGDNRTEGAREIEKCINRGTEEMGKQRIKELVDRTESLNWVLELS